MNANYTLLTGYLIVYDVIILYPCKNNLLSGKVFSETLKSSLDSLSISFYCDCSTDWLKSPNVSERGSRSIEESLISSTLKCMEDKSHLSFTRCIFTHRRGVRFRRAAIFACDALPESLLPLACNNTLVLFGFYLSIRFHLWLHTVVIEINWVKGIVRVFWSGAI